MHVYKNITCQSEFSQRAATTSFIVLLPNAYPTVAFLFLLLLSSTQLFRKRHGGHYLERRVNTTGVSSRQILKSESTRRKKLSMSSHEPGMVVEIDYVYLSKEESNSTIHDDNSSLLSTSTPLRQSPPEKCTSFCNRVLERNISEKSKFHRSRNFFHKFFSHERKEKQTGYEYANMNTKASNENIFQKIFRGLKEHLCGKIFRRVKRNMSKLLRH